MPAHADRTRTGGPTPAPRTGTRRAARLDRRLEHRLTVRASDDLAPLVDLDRRAAGREEPQKAAVDPGYGHGV